jgi:hypothetical protein
MRRFYSHQEASDWKGSGTIGLVPSQSTDSGIQIDLSKKEKTALHHYKDQLVNAVWGNNRCLQWESYETNNYIVGKMPRY